jgi:Raf kinase inhibitor-like YbhB/YbcL family protein
MKTVVTTFMGLALAAGLVLVGTSPVSAQKGGGKKGGINLPPMIKITVDGYADGGIIPNKFTCAASPTAPSPKITWSGAPANTAAYTVLFHDPDPVLGGSATNDVMHWMIFDIPGSANGLPENVAKGADLPDGSKQLAGFAGNGYMGPCAPPGHGAHHYTFEIWALSEKLALPATATRDQVMQAMNGKVLTKGLYVGFFEQK